MLKNNLIIRQLPLSLAQQTTALWQFFDLDGRIAIVQADPMPLDILSLMPLVTVADG